jgi:hypothetical protein
VEKLELKVVRPVSTDDVIQSQSVREREVAQCCMYNRRRGWVVRLKRAYVVSSARIGAET